MKIILTLIAITVYTVCFAGEIQPTISSSTSLPQNQTTTYSTQSSWKVLLSYEGQDLRKLDKKSQDVLQKSIDVILGKTKDNEFYPPRFISKISDAHGQINYILFESSGLLTIPGECSARIHVFNHEGKFLGTSSFSCGWRIDISKMEVIPMPEIGKDVLLVNSGRVVGGYDVAKQYYALVGDKMLLIRLEDSKGKLIRNIYGAPNFAIGLTVVGRSAEDWEKALESQDMAEVLATLTWLSGTHLNPRKSVSSGYVHEDLKEAQVADDVRSRPGVQVTLTTLSRLNNIWVQEAAELAEKVKYSNN